MERTADLVAAFLRERAPGPVVAVGHSMGTQVVLELAVRHPDLLDRLILAAPTVDVRERTALRQLSRLAADLLGESPIVLARGMREYLRAGPHLRRKMRAMLAHRPEDVFGRVAAPTLVLRGEHDLVVPEAWCRFVVDAIPDARMTHIRNHAHETMIRDPKLAAAQILSFAGVEPH
ncbi:hypothetical protein GCM10022240_17160 [Microbacterium kribbense]|uniref:Serine aminopeptidase S33 domain-containing protein n=2 Tax=Microbacterium kribbense TaxID=433645 RepID=A0ABP7GNS5_9MICO